MRGLSLFSGGGGLDIAAESVALQVCSATDIAHDALDVLRTATGVPTLVGDIADFVANHDVLAAWRRLQPDVVFGGPPCTAFSHAGFWLKYKRNGEDPATTGISRFVDVIEEVEPRAFVMENVPGLLFKNHRTIFNTATQRLSALGYHVSAKILKASDFGVAQARRRLFVVGLRGGAVDLDSWPSFPLRTTSWAFESLPTDSPRELDEVPRGKYSRLLATVPPGENYLYHTAERGSREPAFRYRGRYWSFLLKLDPDRPSPTLSAQRVTWNGPFHWSNRHLRVREMARLQSFPDSVRFSSDLQVARRQIGNAVPVVLGAAVLDRVLSTIDPGRRQPSVLQRAMDPDSSWLQVSEAVEDSIRAARQRHASTPNLSVVRSASFGSL